MKSSIRKILLALWLIIKWLVISSVVLSVLLALAINLPPVQRYAIRQGAKWLEKQTGAQIEVGHFELRIPYYLSIGEVQLNRPDGEEILRLRSLRAKLAWRKALDKKILIEYIHIEGLKGTIYSDDKGIWNYDFLLEGLMGDGPPDAGQAETANGIEVEMAERDMEEQIDAEWDIAVQEVLLEEVDLSYIDAESEAYISGIFETLHLRMRRMSSLHSIYHVESLEFSGSESRIDLRLEADEDGQGEAELREDEYAEGESGLPDIALDHLLLERHSVTFNSLGDAARYQARWKAIELEGEALDLEEMRFGIGSLRLEELNADLRLPKSEEKSDYEGFDPDIFLPLAIDAKNIIIDNNQIAVSEFNELNESITLVDISQLGLQIEELKTRPDSYALKLRQAGVQYGPLPPIESLSFDLYVAATESRLEALQLGWGKSELQASLSLTYRDLAALIDEQSFLQASLDLRQLRLHPKEVADLAAMAFHPDSIPPLPDQALRLNLKASGSSRALDFASANLRYGESRIRFSGKGKGAELSTFDWQLKPLLLELHTADLKPWLPDESTEANLPGFMRLEGALGAGPRQSSILASLELPYGSVDLDIEASGWESPSHHAKGLIESAYLDLKELLEVDTAYLASLSTEFDLKHLGSDSMAGHIAVELPRSGMEGFTLENLSLRDSIDGEQHRFSLSLRDSFLIAEATGVAHIGEDLGIAMDADIPGIDLQYFGFSKEDIRMRSALKINYLQSDSTQSGDIDFGPSLVIRDGERIELSRILANFHLSADSTGAEVDSEIFNLRSVSNMSAEGIVAALGDIFRDSEEESDHESAADYWQLDFRSGDSELIRELLLPELSEFEPARARVRYQGMNRKLEASLNFPFVRMGALALDSTSLDISSRKGLSTGRFGIKSIAYDTLRIEQLALSMLPDSVGNHFAFTLGGDSLTAPYRIAAQLNHESLEEGGRWLLKPSREWILAEESWQIDSLAYFRFDSSGTEISDFRMERGKERFELNKGGGEESLFLNARNFDLAAIAGIFAIEEDLFGGMLNAELQLNSDGSFEGDGNIEDLHLLGSDFGEFSWNAQAEHDIYKLSAGIEGPTVDILAEGSLRPQEDALGLDIDVQLERYNAKSLAELLPTLIQEARGESSGKLHIGGSSAAPQLNGQLNFRQIQIKLKGSNGYYALEDEELRIIPSALQFSRFAISDSLGQKLSVTGEVGHRNFSNFKYDLRINSDRFTLVDMAPGEDPMFHGKLIVGSDIRISGSDTKPIIRSDISLKRGSNMVFTVPESSYSDFSDDDLIEWVSFRQSEEDEILTRDKNGVGDASYLATAVDFAGTLNIDKETQFRLIIDPMAGDYLEIAGGGKLALGYDRAGRITLSGTYTVSSGAYQMTFYNIVKRKFLLEPGSRITWNGDPYTADLQLTALYPTRASAAGLMSSGGPAASEGLRRMLGWEIVMNITGELEQPEIGFDLRLDQASRGTMGGAIDTRLVQLRENESELNKQVFALMVFNSFIAEGGAGTTGSDVVANQARNSASQLLTQQLNRLSDKLVGGVELSFDLQSYGSEGQGETDLTVDLQKTLFNDRVVVRVGSTVALEQNDPMMDNSQQLMTNFIVEYKITEDGRYRLKAFRKTDMEDILVGRITRTGAGIVFRRTFDRSNQILRKDSEEKRLEEEEKEQRQQEKNGKNE